MLPTLEAEHWSQTSTEYENDFFKQEFVQLTTSLLGDESVEGSVRDD